MTHSDLKPSPMLWGEAPCLSSSEAIWNAEGASSHCPGKVSMGWRAAALPSASCARGWSWWLGQELWGVVSGLTCSLWSSKHSPAVRWNGSCTPGMAAVHLEETQHMRAGIQDSCNKLAEFHWYFKRKPVSKKDIALCPITTQYKDKTQEAFFFLQDLMNFNILTNLRELSYTTSWNNKVTWYNILCLARPITFQHIKLEALSCWMHI